MTLPRVDHDMYQRGLQFREQEKQHFASLESENKALKQELEDLYTFVEAKQMRAKERRAKILRDQEKDGRDDAGGGVGSACNNSGGRVLSAASGAVENDTHAGSHKVTISSGSTTDVSSCACSSSPSSNSIVPEQPCTQDKGDDQEPDAGRPPDDEADGAERATN